MKILKIECLESGMKSELMNLFLLIIIF